MSGRKTIEVRNWTTTYRGKLWLHVPQKKDFDLERVFGYSDLPIGVYVGYFSVIAIRPITPQRWVDWQAKHLDYGHFQLGFYGWFLGDTVRFKEPIPGAGSLSLFEPPMEILKDLESASIH